MVRVDLKRLLGVHVARSLVAVGESLCFLDLLHLGRVTVLGCEDVQGRVNQFLGENDLLGVKFCLAVLVDPVEQRHVHLLQLLKLPLSNLALLLKDLYVQLCNRFNLTLLVLREMLGSVFIDGVVKDEHLIAFRLILLKNR